MSFDSGVLIGLERGDRQAWGLLTSAVRWGETPLVCAVAVAESWRDGRTQAQLARALEACDVVPVDDELARSGG